jgi:uncharacterized membrane protein YbhN (UPF0104 family)
VVTKGNTGQIAAAICLAYVAGLVGITPAGIGVREGVLAALLPPILGGGPAVQVAVVLRLLDVAADMVVVAVLALRGIRVRVGNRWAGERTRRG